MHNSMEFSQFIFCVNSPLFNTFPSFEFCLSVRKIVKKCSLHLTHLLQKKSPTVFIDDKMLACHDHSY